MRGFHLDPAAPISDNDLVDLLQAAMPINGCHYADWTERGPSAWRR